MSSMELRAPGTGSTGPMFSWSTLSRYRLMVPFAAPRNGAMVTVYVNPDEVAAVEPVAQLDPAVTLLLTGGHRMIVDGTVEDVVAALMLEEDSGS